MKWKLLAACIVALTLLLPLSRSQAQEKLRFSYSSTNVVNAPWWMAKDKGFFKKHGMDPELLFIGSTTVSVQSLIAGDVQFGNATGGGIASANAGGGNLVLVSCFINTLPYQLVVSPSIKTAADLKGKAVGVSRFGSASDTAARFLVKSLGLTPGKDVPILQVGGGIERVSALRTGKIAALSASPGVMALAEGVEYRILADTGNVSEKLLFPYICGATTKSFLASNRDLIKRATMAMIEGTHYFKQNKAETKKIVAKYSRQNNEKYLEEGWDVTARLLERVPYVTMEGAESQVKEVLANRPGVPLKTQDIVDNGLVAEIEKSGFIDTVYRGK
ncbi:MAG: ABC transporter substrate-binding protein [Candidatus Tectomicrobia bacterium]|uniref:ABC transporter substrate-binding protein n=1 Tax=Tectimicrobiota bacterium TaxID=2528274 RepID=A0A932GN49_UNCTE|nr:ABC transporter substrate-binding protein [Candidatus Tectomicrobia bacterium]